jgi:hypothetical protein
MKIINLAMPSLLASLFAGCATQAGEDQVADGDTDETTASDDPSAADRAIDGRAAAALEAKLVGKDLVTVGLASWYTGSIAPGATEHHYWNNAGSTAAYAVGLSPVGASTSATCQMEVVRTWDVQKYGGEREFHFEVKNIGSITCGANILLEGTTRFATWETGGLDVGASRNFYWNNANPLTASYVAGVVPSGATPSNDCKLELTRSWYLRRATGEREFWFTLKNIGAIACQGDIQLARDTGSVSSWGTGTLAAGATDGTGWNNANPLTRAYLPGLSPAQPTSGVCSLEVSRQYYRQRINTDGTAEREFIANVTNSGAISCSGTFLLNRLD